MTASRTDYALAHPAFRPTDTLAPELARIERMPDGNLIRSILAVDR